MGGEHLSSISSSILEALNDVVFAVDSNYNFIYITPSCYFITGYTAEEFLSGFVRAGNLVHPEDYWRLLRENYQAFKTGELPRVTEFRIVRKDGQVKWVSIYWSVVKDENGNVKYIQGVMHDVTERKIAEEKLQKTLSELKILHSFSSELSSAMTIDEVVKSIYDHIVKVIPVESFFIDIYDEEMEQLKGLAHVYSIHGRRVMISYPNYRFSIKSHELWKELIYEKKTKCVRYSGKDIPSPYNLFIDESETGGFILSTPMFSRGKILGVMTLQISGDFEIDEAIPFIEQVANQSAVAIERVRYFIELQESEKSLRQAYEELKRVHQQLLLTEKMRTLGQLAGGIVHTLSNFLSAILGRAQLLKTKLTDESLLKEIELIEKAGQDASRVISRLREFSKPRTHPNLIPLDLANIIEDALEITKSKWKDEAELKGVKYEIVKDFPEDRLMGITNASELREAIVNIILNAIEAMPNGGKLTVGIYNINNEKVAIYISDTGIGMDSETMARIFEPFFTTKGSSGTGLGLSIAYEIIKSHNGEILVESELGKGSKFIIVLPASREKVYERVTERKETEKVQKLNVLLVEDDESVLYLLRDIFTGLGCKIAEAMDGKKALEYVKVHEFDLVVTDLALPDFSGWVIAKEVKDKNANTPVIMLTGWGIDITVNDAKKRGVDYLITKPFELDELLLIVNNAIQSINKK
jgi:PAS domain S-box-containing protein